MSKGRCALCKMRCEGIWCVILHINTRSVVPAILPGAEPRPNDLLNNLEPYPHMLPAHYSYYQTPPLWELSTILTIRTKLLLSFNRDCLGGVLELRHLEQKSKGNVICDRSCETRMWTVQRCLDGSDCISQCSCILWKGELQ